jgi:tight adherence protein B
VAILDGARASILREVERLSAIGPLNRALGGDGVVAGWLRTTIQQSGLKITAGQLLLGSACLFLLVLAGVVSTLHLWSLGLVLGAVAAGLPYMIVRTVRARRLRQFEEHFPEAVDLIARTLRAGHAFATGLRLASEELPAPVATEFQLLHDQQNFGLPMNEALKGFARRVPIIDAQFFATAVLTQREAGGNLAEVLDNLSAVIRERFRIKRQIRVITAHGRLTGAILTAAPPLLAIFLVFRMPDQMRLLVSDPLGVKMIIVAAILQVAGGLLIRRITDIEY